VKTGKMEILDDWSVRRFPSHKSVGSLTPPVIVKTLYLRVPEHSRSNEKNHHKHVGNREPQRWQKASPTTSGCACSCIEEVPAKARREEKSEGEAACGKPRQGCGWEAC
jgi:hypothetical protein